MCSCETTKTSTSSFTVSKWPMIHKKGKKIILLFHTLAHMLTCGGRACSVCFDRLCPTAQAAVRSRPRQIIGSSVSMKALLDFCTHSVRMQHILQPLLHLQVRRWPLRSLFITIINLLTPLGTSRHFKPVGDGTRVAQLTVNRRGHRGSRKPCLSVLLISLD